MRLITVDFHVSGMPATASRVDIGQVKGCDVQGNDLVMEYLNGMEMCSMVSMFLHHGQ